MINKSIIKALLDTAKEENKDMIINELLNHISLYDYNDVKSKHILEMLVDSKTIVNLDKIYFTSIIENFDKYLYHSDRYNIRNVKIESIDNIDCIIKVSYEYIEKINEDRGDIDYTSSYININFVDNPEVLYQ